MDGGAGDDWMVGGNGIDIIHGGEGADIVFGFGGHDVIDGGDGSDFLFGDSEQSGDSYRHPIEKSGNDLIDGGEGNDTIWGSVGDDKLIGGNGDDWILGDDEFGATIDFHGNDILNGGAGNDSLIGHGGNDILSGEIGDDQLDGGSGDDQLNGGLGADALFGGAGNDILTGGEGVDFLEGGAGDDTYLIDALDVPTGNGVAETIRDSEGANSLVIGGAVTYAASFGRDLQVWLGPANEDRRLIIENAFGNAFTSVSFGGASTTIRDWAQEHVTDRLTLTAGAGQRVFGGRANDVLSSNAAGATLDGGKGDDRYYFEAPSGTGGTTIKVRPGDGLDTAVGAEAAGTLAPATPAAQARSSEPIPTPGRAANVLEFGAGVTPDSVRLEYRLDPQGNFRLFVAYGESGDAVAISDGGFDEATASILRAFDEFRFADGTTMTWETLEAKGALLDIGKNPNAYGPTEGSFFRDVVLGSDGGDIIRTGMGNDEIDAGKGNDDIDAGPGHDTVLFGRGYGQDRWLVQSGSPDTNGTDTLRFKDGVAPTDVLFVRKNNDLVATIKGTTDSMTVVEAYGSNSIDLVRFADGTQMAFADLPMSSAAQQATAGNDVIYTADKGESVDALSGDDVLYGGIGPDTLKGGPGNDKLYGGAGNDRLEDADGAWFDGGEGDDTLIGLASVVNESTGFRQRVDAGPGNDYVDVVATHIDLGRGNDTLVMRNESVVSATYLPGATTGSDQRTVRFASGIAPSAVTARLNQGSLELSWPAGAGSRTLVLLAVNELEASQQNYKFVFDDSPSTIWSFNDVFRLANIGTDANNTLYGTSGNDAVDAKGGDDFVYGRAGNDSIKGGDGNDMLYGEAGNDNLFGDGGKNWIYGGDGNDVIWATTGEDTLEGGSGQDEYRVGSGIFKTTVRGNSPSAEDTLIFEAGIQPTAISVSHKSTADLDAVLHSSLNGMGSVVLSGLFDTRASANSPIKEVRFVDDASTIWTPSQLLEMVTAGSPADDLLYGFDDRADNLRGYGANDTLYAGSGDDTLVGGKGQDELRGGTGQDTYVFERGDGRDLIIEADGTDTVKFGSGISPAQVSLTRTSSRTADYWAGEDMLVISVAGAPNGVDEIWIANHFTGGTQSIEVIEFANGTKWGAAEITSRTLNANGSANTQTGTIANDTFTVDHRDDVVVELANGGTDTVNSSVSFTLPNNVENINLTGGLSINATGNILANTINGNDADNTLNGVLGYINGSFQPDTLVGKNGNDAYEITYEGTFRQPRADDTSTSLAGSIIELQNGGVDTLKTDQFRVKIPDNVENLIGLPHPANSVSYQASRPLSSVQTFKYYAGSSYYGSDLRVWYVGNSLDNSIDASKASPITRDGGFLLDGGAGADTLIGGSGEVWLGQAFNTYVIDNAGDTVVATGGSDADVMTSSTVSLAVAPGIEIVELTGTLALNATGDARANQLRGSRNPAKNVLAGMGGDDLYFVDPLDAVVEAADGGTDTVVIDLNYSDVTGLVHSLDNYTNVENIAANGEFQYVGDIKGVQLVGNALANVVSGSFNNDTLRGGTGDDVVEDQFLKISPTGNARGDKDVLYGEDGNDQLISWGGNDSLFGGAGNDTLDGGSGNDVLDGGLGNDIVLFGKGDGQDTLRESEADSSGTRINTIRFKAGLAQADVNVSRSGNNITLSLKGSSDQISVQSFFSGNTASHALNPLQLVEFADGSSWDLAQISTLAGPALNQAPSVASPLADQAASVGVAFNFAVPSGSFVDPDAGDVLQYAATLASGTALPSWLTFNASTLTFSGQPASTGDVTIRVTASDIAGLKVSDDFVISVSSANKVINGTSGPDSLKGGVGNDTLNGLAGNDTLDGSTGTDTLVGGTGNDTYMVDNTGDVVTEAASAGTDLVQSSVTYTLPANVENLTLTGTTAINGTGNTLANVLTGNAGANMLDGGAGKDTLVGGAGDDTYMVDNTGDVVTEATSAGTDVVQSSVTYTLPANVENLTLTGTTAINGTGNTLANVLTGNAGTNTLTGGAGNDTLDGGAGADKLVGGAGDDTYVVDNTGDVVTEAVSAGADLVQSSVTYTLPTNVENLTLTGTTAINGTGNTLANVLIGNSANNTLTGGAGNDTLNGGEGADTLVGGAGNDTYVLGRGYGADTVQENDATAGNTDLLRFNTGIATDQIWFRKTGSNLEVSIIGTSDKMSISNWYGGQANRLEQFKTSDGKTLLDTQVDALVSAMAAFSPPAAGQTTLPASYQTALGTLLAANWK